MRYLAVRRRVRCWCILGRALQTKKPNLRVTKWLSGDIPLEAECTACADARFNVQFDPRERFHQPTRQSCAHQLQRQYDAHLKAVHCQR
jgi:hypothetical protein